MRRILIALTLLLCISCGRGEVDVWSTNPWPANELSNLYDWPFEFQGVQCGSFEGFLQALKSPQVETQVEICALGGHDAKHRSTSEWKADQMLYWQGDTLGRQSERFYELLSAAYDAMYEANPGFRKALKATGRKVIRHTKGKKDPTDTVLTEEEFCRELTRLRARR